MQKENIMSKTFASANYTAGQLNAIVKLLQQQGNGQDAPDRYLRGELVVSEPVRRWEERDGVIYLTVTSDGTTGSEWITRLEKNDFHISNYVKQLLCSSDFQPTSGVICQIAILKGMIFSDKDRVTKKIRAYTSERNFSKPNAEVACLIRENFSDEEIKAMGLIWIITMHEPIKDSDGDLYLLNANRDHGGRWLNADYGNPVGGWGRENGFAFVVSQVSSES